MTSSDLVQKLYAVHSVVWYKDNVCSLGAGQLDASHKVGMQWHPIYQPGLNIM